MNTMSTNQQQKRAEKRAASYKAAARKYCELAGLNPDERVQIHNPEGFAGFAVATYTPRYALIALQMEERHHELVALKYAGLL